MAVFGLTSWLQLEFTPLILSLLRPSPQIQEEVANLQAIKLKLQSNDAEGAGGKFVLKCPKVKLSNLCLHVSTKGHLVATISICLLSFNTILIMWQWYILCDCRVQETMILFKWPYERAYSAPSSPASSVMGRWPSAPLCSN